MPLEIYQRGRKWWIRGRTDGIDGYINRSLGTLDEAVAKTKRIEIERKAQQRAILGSEAPTEADELTFSGAAVLYDAKPADAKFLVKVIPEIGNMKIKDIKPKLVRDLGKKLYPKAACDTWRRQVVTPVCAVINNAHHEKGTPLIRVKAYTAKERQEQDRERGKQSRVEKTPGSWEWLNAFRAEANRYQSALALFMFTTGARITQSVLIEPKHLDLQNGRLWLPEAKGHPAQWVDLTTEVVVELANLPPRNKRVFGYQHRWGVYKAWKTACKNANIEYIPPHSAGRHGFGTELIVRQGVDPATVAKHGRWHSPRVPLDTYTHSDKDAASVHDAFQRGREAEFTKPKQSKSGK
ncbi:tyrosine-type recombinase/integrase [Roseibium sp.]|uniref:tyrosine-type recombinase/integrase n=1 Tax=Roseibium sp. TaxID=1936156 RepID=UPI003B515741